jgi:hypothetical protein
MAELAELDEGDPAEVRTISPGEVRCGEIADTPRTAWEHEGDRFVAMRASWVPRAEYGEPVAIRSLVPPVDVEGLELFHVRVLHAPQRLQRCWVPSSVAAESRVGACMQAEDIVAFLSRDAHPRTVRDWALLIGSVDEASAVFTSARELEHCPLGLPRAARATLPSLGLRNDDGVEHVTFIERVETALVTQLIVVDARIDGDRSQIERRELSTIERTTSR